MRVTGKAGLVIISSFAAASAAIAGAATEKSHAAKAAPILLFVPVDQVAPVALIDDFDAPFADFDRIMAEMDRQSDAMLRQAALLGAQPATGGAQLDPAVLANLPAGTVSYSFISTSNGQATCSQSWQITSYGAGQKPKLVSQTSGNCGSGAPGKAAPAVQPQPSSALPKVVPAKLDPAPAPAKPADRT